MKMERNDERCAQRKEEGVIMRQPAVGGIFWEHLRPCLLGPLSSLALLSITILPKPGGFIDPVLACLH